MSTRIIQFASTRKTLVVAWMLVSSMALAMAYLVIISLRLRPLADDYCSALHAKSGLFGAIAFWWSTWAGDVFGVTLFSLFTGLPILLLPIGVAGAVPFSAVILSVAFLGWLLASRARSAKPGDAAGKMLKPSTLLLTLGFATAWIGYWWIPASLRADFEMGLAVSATMWPTVGTLYILPAFIAVATLVVVLTSSSSVWQYVGFLLGILIGLSGLVLGLSTALTIVGYLLVSQFLGVGDQAHRSGYLRAGVVTMVGVLAGAIAASLSPGTRARSQDQLQEFSLPVALNRAFPETIFRLLDSYTSTGAIVTFLFFVGLGLVVAHLKRAGSATLGPDVLILLIIFSIASTFSSALSDGVIYVAVWHQVVPYVMTFLVFSLGGLMAGQYAARLGNHPQALLVVLATVATVGLFTSINAFAGIAAERKGQWSIGAAPIGGISDIEDAQFRACWEGIREAGDLRVFDSP